MKTQKIQTGILLTVSVIMMLSCTNKNDDSVGQDIIKSNLTGGNWTVSNFNDSGNDETYKFNSYVFVFESNGTLTAVGSTTQTGSWSAGNDDSTVKLYLTFSSVSPFDEITGDWHVIEQNSSIIKLEDISGGNGGTDYLTFTSNK